MTSSASGTASRIVCRTVRRTSRAAAGCAAMYSSAHLKSVFAIVGVLSAVVPAGITSRNTLIAHAGRVGRALALDVFECGLAAADPYDLTVKLSAVHSTEPPQGKVEALGYLNSGIPALTIRFTRGTSRSLASP